MNKNIDWWVRTALVDVLVNAQEKIGVQEGSIVAPVLLRLMKDNNLHVAKEALDAMCKINPEWKHVIAIDILFRDILETKEAEAEDKRIKLMIQYPDGNIFVQRRDNRYTLKDDVILELITNALKYTPDGGTVTVALRQEEKDVVFSVKDTGIGIPESEKRKVWMYRYRAPNAVSRGDGNGLGLTIMRDIVVDNYEGRIELESSEGAGTTFTVRIPIGKLPDLAMNAQPQKLVGIPSTTRIPLKFIKNDADAHEYLIRFNKSRDMIYAALFLFYGIRIYNYIKSNDVFALFDFNVWLSLKSYASYNRVRQLTENFDKKYSVTKITEAYLSYKQNDKLKDGKLFTRLRWLLTNKDIAPRAFAIAANGDLIIYWKEPYIRKKLAPIIYPIPYWIAPLENWRQKTVSKKTFSWKILRSLKPAPISAQSTHSRLAMFLISSGKTIKGGIDLNPAQMSIQVNKEGEDFKFNFNGTTIDAAQVTGATFTIRQMTPVTNLSQILGLNLGATEKTV